jgi:hypothetical protein
MNKFIFPFLLILLTTCKRPEPKKETKTMDFGAFTIKTPLSWHQLKQQGIDSYAGGIVIDGKDTLSFDLGMYSNTLTELEPQIVERSLLPNLHQPVDTSELIIVEKRRGADPDKYKKQNISWDTIDGHTAKIVYPIKSGLGITGVYIDSLWDSGSGIVRFNLYGQNLDPETEKNSCRQ